MKLSLLLVALLSFISFAYAWSKEDYEIFDLVSAIEAAEGKGTTFYSWLEISPKATSSEISKAYRKKSMALHPDKNPGVKGLQERFARLGVITKILREPESRERYDFFFKNGVPRWRGTGYYYSRYRPGLGSVLVFLTILSSVLQLLVQKLNYKKDLDRINRFVTKARMAAWGPKMIPQAASKRVRVSLDTNGPDSDGASGRSVEMLVDEQHVYLVGEGDPVLLDENVATKPSITNTWVINIVKALVAKVIPKDTQQADDQHDQSAEATLSGEDETDAAEGIDGRASTPGGSKVKPSATATAKAGGRRRKNVGPRR